jgi:hypothetical protein
MPAPISPRLSWGSSTRSRQGRRPKAAAYHVAALYGLICLVLCGCKRPPKPLVAPTPVYVNLGAVLIAHPAWADVQQIDTLITYARSTARSSAPPPMALQGVGLPPALQTQEPPVPVLRPSQDELRRPALGRVARLRELYEAQNARVLARERKEALKKLEADVAAYKAELVSNPNPVDLTVQRQVDAELRRLQFLEIAYESQVRVLFEPYVVTARQLLADVRRRIKAEQARLKVSPDTFEERVAAAADAFRTKRVAEYQMQLSSRSAELAVETSRTLDEYVKRIETRLDAVEAILPLAIPARIPLDGGGMPGPAQVAAATQTLPSTPPPAVTDPTKALISQRARLIAWITDDVKRRVERIAGQKNWQVSWSPAASRVDVAAQAAELLRAEFTRKAGP